MNPYGETKVCVEMLIRSLGNLKESCFVSLRYFNPVGAHSSYLIGEEPENPQNLLPIIEQVVQGKRQKLFVFGSDYDTPDGSGIRDYIHIIDLADAHVRVIEKFY